MIAQHRPVRARLERAARAHINRSERGITFVIFALAIVALLGMIGLGVDGGRIFDERRHAQNAADHAAMSAAYASCVRGLGTAEAEAAGIASAAENGYDNDGTSNTVALMVDGASQYTFTATVWTRISTTFARAIGFSHLETTVTAQAAGTGCGGGGGGPGAVYAGGTCPSLGKYAFDVSGSTNRVFGGVHVNDDANIGGSGNLFTEAGDPDDPFTYVGLITQHSDDTFQTGYPLDVGPALPDPVWPAGFDPSVVTGGTGVPSAGSFLRPYYDLAVANGTFSTGKISDISSDGVYYTTSTDGMDIGSVSGSVRNIVLVASRGPIKISASGVTFNSYQHESLPMPNLLILSNQVYTGDEACDKFTVAVSGSSSTWNGLIWGPRGLVEMSGSSNTAVNGSLVGHAVRLNGSDLTIAYDGGPASELPDILLLQ